MADKSVTTYELKIEFLFTDGDTRVQSLKNPISQIQSSAITDLETLIRDSESEPSTPLLIGDKAGAMFQRINTAVKETKTVTTLDLGLS